ncbi:MAG: hypothetical protein R3D67_16050 [Hyphomicrobiaceae bacterium]
MRGFRKLAAERAYATGAIRSNLSIADLAAKLRRGGLEASADRGSLVIRLDGEAWLIANWEPDGVGRIGWLEMKELGDAGGLSQRLARIGVRHKLQYSRPRDLETSDIRTVTQYDYRWDTPGLPPPSDNAADVTMYDEKV